MGQNVLNAILALAAHEQVSHISTLGTGRQAVIHCRHLCSPFSLNDGLWLNEGHKTAPEFISPLQAPPMTNR